MFVHASEWVPAESVTAHAHVYYMSHLHATGVEDPGPDNGHAVRMPQSRCQPEQTKQSRGDKHGGPTVAGTCMLAYPAHVKQYD